MNKLRFFLGLFFTIIFTICLFGFGVEELGGYIFLFIAIILLLILYTIFYWKRIKEESSHDYSVKGNDIILNSSDTILLSDVKSSKATPSNGALSTQFIYCRKCGCKLPPDSNFCSKCGTEVYADKAESTPLTTSSVDAEEQYTTATLNKSSRRSDPWEISRPTPKKNTAKIVCLCAFILFVATMGIILFNNNGQGIYHYDSTNAGDAPSADSVNPNTQTSYDVKKVKVTAESSSGIGDAYSRPIAHPDYFIYDCQIDQIFEVNYKVVGGIGVTEMSLFDDTLLPVYGPINDCWYNVLLPGGTTGFIWGGTDGMYVEEIE